VTDYETVMTDIVEYYLEQIEKDASANGLNDFRLAREEFHKLAGEFEEGEPWFEVRMTMFLDWYLLERRGQDGRTPCERYLANHGAALDESGRTCLMNLRVSLRSVFQIDAVIGDSVILSDLIGGGEWQVVWNTATAGLTANSILNTRLMLSPDRIIAGRGTVLHPPDADEHITRIIDRGIAEQMQRERLVYYLDKVRLKLDRYANVRIKHVYQYPGDAAF